MTLDTDNGRTDSTLEVLLCRVADLCCALPGARVVEVMRALPIDPLAGTPPSIRGLSIVRGAPVPVVDAGCLLHAAMSRGGYFVTIDVAGRPVALAVDQVIGLQRIGDAAFAPLPPLLRNADDDTVAAIRARDGELLLLLDAARLVPAELLGELTGAGARR